MYGVKAIVWCMYECVGCRRQASPLSRIRLSVLWQSTVLKTTVYQSTAENSRSTNI